MDCRDNDPAMTILLVALDPAQRAASLAFVVMFRDPAEVNFARFRHSVVEERHVHAKRLDFPDINDRAQQALYDVTDLFSLRIADRHIRCKKSVRRAPQNLNLA